MWNINRGSLCHLSGPLSIVYSQGVQTWFYESTPPTRDPLGNKISSGARRDSGHAGTNIPYASEEHDNRGAPDFPRILLKRIPGTKSFRTVASSHTFKKSERSHLGTSLSYVHYKLSSEYGAKRRLRVQDRSAGCVLLHTDLSMQQDSKYLRFAFENKVYQFRVLPFGLNTAPQVFTPLRHTVTGYLHHLGISVVPYLDDWLIHHPDQQVLLHHQA